MADLLPVITGIAGALVGGGGLALSGWRQRRDSLDDRVERSVKSQVGDRFMDFLDVGERTSRQVTEIAEAASSEAEAMIRSAQAKLDEFDHVREVTERLENLLARADALVPNLDIVVAATPSVILNQLRTSDSDSVAIGALVQKLVESATATSKQLEEAGDIVRQQFEDTVAARQLYELSIERNPSNTSARAELLALDLEDSTDEAADSARQRLRELAIARPQVRTPLIKLLNDYVARSAYVEMESDIRQLLESNPHDPLLWRNLAVAREHLQSDPESIREAYEQALDYARPSDADPDFVNTAKSFVNWLARENRFEDAEAVLAKALERMPFESSLYFASYRLESARGDTERARRSLQLMKELGDRQEQQVARQLRLGLDSLEFLTTGRRDDPNNATESIAAALEVLAAMAQANDEGESEQD